MKLLRQHSIFNFEYLFDNKLAYLINITLLKIDIYFFWFCGLCPNEKHYESFNNSSSYTVVPVEDTKKFLPWWMIWLSNQYIPRERAKCRLEYSTWTQELFQRFTLTVKVGEFELTISSTQVSDRWYLQCFIHSKKWKEIIWIGYHCLPDIGIFLNS